MSSIIGINHRRTDTILPPTKINLTHEGFIAKKPHRQVSFITLEGENRLREDEKKGFCHSRFRADFIVSCLDIIDIKVKDQLKIGTSLIEITEIEKECHDNCPAITVKGSCHVNGTIFFGRIVKEGIVKVNDKIKII